MKILLVLILIAGCCPQKEVEAIKVYPKGQHGLINEYYEFTTGENTIVIVYKDHTEETIK